MPNSSEKGARRERELVNILDERDWGLMRAPASGSRTDRELPDFIAGNGHIVVAGEVKTSRPDNRIYVQPKKVSDLKYFAKMFQAVPLVFVRWDQDTTWYWEHIDEIPRTPSSRLSITSDKRDSWKTLEDLAGLASRRDMTASADPT